MQMDQLNKLGGRARDRTLLTLNWRKDVEAATSAALFWRRNAAMV